MLQFVGFEVLAPQIGYGPVRLRPGQRIELLTAYARRLKDIASETPVDVGIYYRQKPSLGCAAHTTSCFRKSRA